MIILTMITLAAPPDFKYVLSLSKKHAEELGFLPAAAMESYLHRGRITLAHENSDPCGYFLVGALGRPQLRIFQACVQYDARGLDHGISLLSNLIVRAAASGTQFLSLHCRDGLDSNGFWSACGFRSGGLILGGSARRKIVHQWELDISEALSNPSLPYAAAYIAAIGSRTSEGIGSTEGRGIEGTPPPIPLLM